MKIIRAFFFYNKPSIHLSISLKTNKIAEIYYYIYVFKKTGFGIKTINYPKE